MDPKPRCPWPGDDPLYLHYHDHEWGVPEYDGRQLLAKLILDGAQAGLSWITILRKRDAYYAAFDNFDPETVARYDDAKIAQLLQNPGIVRNRLKIHSAVNNARAYLTFAEQHGSFSDFLWQFTGGAPRQNHFRTLADLPAQTPESEAMSKALKAHGFTFAGPTICYAFMQATGMVNDHLITCFRHAELQPPR
jgi:DNA-3-methyladenine glycosylase I